MVQAVPLTPGADEGKAREAPHLVPPVEEPSEGERAKVESGEAELSPEERERMTSEVEEKVAAAKGVGEQMKSTRERLDEIYAAHQEKVLTPEEQARKEEIWFDAIEKIEELDVASGKVLKVTEYQPSSESDIESVEESIAAPTSEQQPAPRKPPASSILPPRGAVPGDFARLQVVRTPVDTGPIDTGATPPKAREPSSLRLVTPLPEEKTPTGPAETGGESPLDAVGDRMEAIAEVALDSNATREQIEAAQDAIYQLAAANRHIAGEQRFALDRDAANLLAMLRRRMAAGRDGSTKTEETPAPTIAEATPRSATPEPTLEEFAAAKSIKELVGQFKDIDGFVADGVIQGANADLLKEKWLADYQPTDDERASYESLRQSYHPGPARENTATGVDIAPEPTHTWGGGGGTLERTLDDGRTTPDAVSFAGGGDLDTDIAPARAWGDGPTKIDVGPKTFAEGTAAGELAPSGRINSGERHDATETAANREVEQRFTQALLDANRLVREGKYVEAQMVVGQAQQEALRNSKIFLDVLVKIMESAGTAEGRIEEAAATAGGISADEVRRRFEKIGLDTSIASTAHATGGGDGTMPGELAEDTRTGTASASEWGGGDAADTATAAVGGTETATVGRAAGGETQTVVPIPDVTRTGVTAAGVGGEVTDVGIAPPSVWGGEETTGTTWDTSTAVEVTAVPEPTLVDAGPEPTIRLWTERNQGLLRERFDGDAAALETALAQERFTSSREVLGDPATARSIEALVRSFSGKEAHVQLRADALADLAERTGLDPATLEGILAQRDARLREEAHAAVLGDASERKKTLLKGAGYLAAAGGLVALGPLGWGVATTAGLAYAAGGIAGFRSIETWLSGKLLGKKVDAKLAERRAALGGDEVTDDVRRVQSELALEIARRKQEQINDATGETGELDPFTRRALNELRPDLSPEAREQMVRATRGLHVVMSRTTEAEARVAGTSAFGKFFERAKGVIGKVWQGGSTTGERALTTAVFGAAGVFATIGQVTPLRRVLLGYAGGRVGETLVRLKLGKGEQPVTGEQIAEVDPATLSAPEGRAILDRAHTQLADPKFLKERPAEYQALFEAVTAHEERMIASLGNATDFVSARTDAIEGAIAQKADGDRRRALIVHTGRALGAAVGVFAPEIIGAVRGWWSPEAAAATTRQGGVQAESGHAAGAGAGEAPSPPQAPEFTPRVFGEVQAKSGGGFVDGLKGALGATSDARAQAIRLAQEAGVLDGRTTLRGIDLPEGHSAKFYVDTRTIGEDGVIRVGDVKVIVTGPEGSTETIPLKEFANGPRFAYDFRAPSGAGVGPEAPAKSSGDQSILEELKKRKPGPGPWGADYWPSSEGGGGVGAEAPSAPHGAETGGAGSRDVTPDIPRAAGGETRVGPGVPAGEAPPAAGGGGTRNPFGGGEFNAQERASGGDTSGWKEVATRIERASGGVLKATESTGTFRIGDRGPIISPEGLKMSAGEILTKAHPAGGDLAKVQSWFAERLAAAHPDWLSTRGVVNAQELSRHLGVDGGKTFIDYLKGNPGLSRAGK